MVRSIRELSLCRTRGDGHVAFALGLSVLLAAALRWLGLNHSSLWGDEINVAVVASGSLKSILEGARSHASAPPLDYLVVRLLLTVGRHEFILRFGVVAWSILSIPLIYQLGKRVAGRWVGVASAVLLATSPFHVWYAREVKFYAALLFFSLLSNLTFLRALGCARRRDWVLYALVGCVGLYFHFFVAFIIACHGIYLLLHWLVRVLRGDRLLASCPRGFVPYLLCAIVSAACFAPWFVWDITSQTTVGEYHTAMTFSLVWNLLLSFGQGVPWAAILLATAASLSLAASATSKEARHAPLLALNLLAVAVVVWVDNLQSYWFEPKQALFALPAYLVLASLGFVCLPGWIARWASGKGRRTGIRRWSRLLATALIVSLLIAVSVAAGLSVVRASSWEKQDWRGVGQYLQQHVRSDDWVIQTWVLQPHSLSWYFRPRAEGISTLLGNRIRTTAIDLKPGEDVWWVVVHNGQKQQLIRAAGHRFEITLFAWLAVLHQKGGTADSQSAQAATASLLALQADLNPADPQPYRALAGELLRAGGFPLARFCVDRGNEQAAQQRWEGAAESYQQATVAWPSWGMAHTKLGNAYRALGRQADAEASYRRSIEVEPTYVGAHINLGLLLQGQGKSQEALSHFERAVQVAPDSAWAHSALGSHYLVMGDSSQALAHLERGVEIEPQNVTWLLALADACRLLGNSSRAAELYQQVLVLQPGHPRATEALQGLQP